MYRGGLSANTERIGIAAECFERSDPVIPIHIRKIRCPTFRTADTHTTAVTTLLPIVCVSLSLTSMHLHGCRGIIVSHWTFVMDTVDGSLDLRTWKGLVCRSGIATIYR